MYTGISPHLLSVRMKKLEKAGIVQRRAKIPVTPLARLVTTDPAIEVSERDIAF
jgi:DNA-binding HxlR family transcriptional regulator